MLLCLVLSGLPLQGANQWKMQFFYDKDTSSLEFRDLRCPSPTTCLGAAVLLDRGKPKGILVATYDGGAHWANIEVKELPYSLYFLDSSTGWMVTNKGIWQTLESGRDWKKLSSLKGIERVWFIDASHGFAVGEMKAIYETKNSGKDWTKREVPTPRAMEAKDLVYQGITFSGLKHGVIYGSWNPMQSVQETEWMEVDPAKRPKSPISTVLTETLDGGVTWTAMEAHVRGRLARLDFLDNHSVLALVEFLSGGDDPSEVFKIDLSSRVTSPTFHQANRIGRDMLILPNGEVVVAAVERLGKSNELPIPGKLSILHSTSLSTWLDEKIDYRAVARKPILAGADANNVWLATDTGMILKRIP